MVKSLWKGLFNFNTGLVVVDVFWCGRVISLWGCVRNIVMRVGLFLLGSVMFLLVGSSDVVGVFVDEGVARGEYDRLLKSEAICVAVRAIS